MYQAVALHKFVIPIYCISYMGVLFPPPSLHFFVFTGTLLLACT